VGEVVTAPPTPSQSAGNLRPMPYEAGEHRPVSHWGALRAVCHDCRGVTTVTEHVDLGDAGTDSDSNSDEFSTRTIVVPGDGTISRNMAADTDTGETIVIGSCPTCGSSADPGWLPGFAPPV
jgi:hypothetical protein